MANSTSGIGTFNRAMFGAKNAGSNVSLSAWTYRNPETASLLTRLVSSQRNLPTFDGKGNRTIPKPNVGDLKNISSSVVTAATNSENIMNLFSDVRVACMILIASIRSPNSMHDGEVNHSLRDDLYITPLTDKLLPLVRTYFKDVYPLADKFDEILRETLFGSGSKPILIMPENSLSDLIYGEGKSAASESMQNVSLESLIEQEFNRLDQSRTYESIGFLGSPGEKRSKDVHALEHFYSPGRNQRDPSDKFLQVSFEGHKITSNCIVINDNPRDVMINFMGKIVQECKRARSMESIGGFHNEFKVNDREIARLLYRNTTGREREFVKVKTDNELKRYSVGRPYTPDLPPESVIPIVSRSRTGKPVAFIVLIDSEGAPLSRVSESEQFKALQQQQQAMSNNANAGNAQYGDMSSFLLNRAAAVFSTNCKDLTLRQVNRVHEEILEADLSARFSNGFIGGEVAVSDITLLSEMMLYRQLSNQRTQMLFVPASMMCYFAYDYRDNGTGKNLLEESTAVASMRAQLLVARVMGAVKNAIGRKKVTVDIDPLDQDAQGTFQVIKDETIKANSVAAIPTSINPSDLMNQVQAMSFEFEVQGNESLPQTKVGFSETSSSYNRPDEDLTSELRDLMIDGIGVPMELIDEAKRAQFATVSIASNIMFSRRVRDIQKRYDPQLSEFVCKMLAADVTFIKEIKNVIKENIDLLPKDIEELKHLEGNQAALIDYMAHEFISNLQTTLAKPDLRSIENNMEAINKQKEIIEMAIDFFFSEEATGAKMIGEEASQELEAQKNMMKNALMRQFILDNGIVPELTNMFAENGYGEKMWDIGDTLASHGISVGRLVLDIREKLTRIAQAAQQEGEKVTDKVGPPIEAGSGGGYDTSSSSDSGGGDDFGSDDFSSDDMPPSDTSTASDAADPDADGAGLGDITAF